METQKISIDWLDVEFEFNYDPGDPGVHTYANGDPGYSPTGAEIEIIKAWWTDDKKNNKEITPVFDAYLEWREKTYLPKVKTAVRDEDVGYCTAGKALRGVLGSFLYEVNTFKYELWEKIENHTELKYKEFSDIFDVFIINDIDYDSVVSNIDEAFEEPEPDYPEPDDYNDQCDDATEWGGQDV